MIRAAFRLFNRDEWTTIVALTFLAMIALGVIQ